MQVLPVFFKLFECQDKALRQLLFRHIIAGEARPSVACQRDIASINDRVCCFFRQRCPANLGDHVCQPANVALNCLQPLCADVKSSNRKHRNDKMNRAIQNFLYGALQVRESHLFAAAQQPCHLARVISPCCWGRNARSCPQH